MVARNELLTEIQHKRALGARGTAILASLHIADSESKSSLARSVRAKIIDLGNAPPNTIVAFDGGHAVIITDEKGAAGLMPELTKIEEFLTAQHLGTLTTRMFHVPDDSHALFAALAPEVRSEGHLLHTAPGAASDRVKDVDHLLDLEQMLRAADLANLIRERPVYDFSNRNEPALTHRELVVDIGEIGRLAHVGFRNKPWLFSEVMGILDRRMLSYVLRDRARDDGNLSVNLRVRSVLSDAFRQFAGELTDPMIARLSCELDFHEIQAYPEMGALAVRRLRDAGLTVIIDAVPITQLEASAKELPAINGQYKFEWRSSMDLDREDFDAGTVAGNWRINTLGPDKCVLLHCHSPRVIENGLALGFTQLEGFEVTAYVRAHQTLVEVGSAA